MWIHNRTFALKINYLALVLCGRKNEFFWWKCVSAFQLLFHLNSPLAFTQINELSTISVWSAHVSWFEFRFMILTLKSHINLESTSVKGGTIARMSLYGICVKGSVFLSDCEWFRWISSFATRKKINIFRVTLNRFNRNNITLLFSHKSNTQINDNPLIQNSNSYFLDMSVIQHMFTYASNVTLFSLVKFLLYITRENLNIRLTNDVSNSCRDQSAAKVRAAKLNS